VRYATSAERHPERWVELVEKKGHGQVEAAELTRAQEADEMLLMGLRLAEGVDLGRLAAKGDGGPSAAAIGELAELGLVEVVSLPAGGRRIRATGKGRFVLNEIVLRLSLGLAPGRRVHSPMDIRSAAD
jgi:oxygen-independent coproporphyrinogen-3 oxidase